jgi:ribosomal protein S10
MKEIKWDLKKSNPLKKTRGVSFEEIVHARLVAIKKHPKKPHQNIMLFELDEYIWVVPYVENANEIFLKTLFPSRRHTKIYKRGELS